MNVVSAPVAAKVDVKGVPQGVIAPFSALLADAIKACPTGKATQADFEAAFSDKKSMGPSSAPSAPTHHETVV